WGGGIILAFAFIIVGRMALNLNSQKQILQAQPIPFTPSRLAFNNANPIQTTAPASLIKSPKLTPTALGLQNPTGTSALEIKPLAITPTPMGGGASQIAFASDQHGTSQIYLMSIDGSGLTQITNLAEGACQPNFSPDGMRIVFISPCLNNRELYPSAGMFIINVDGSNIVPLPSVPGGDFDPKWSPDGKFILFTSLRIVHRPRLYLMDLATFEVKLLSEKYGIDYQGAWSSDGKKIAYISRKTGSSNVWTMNADGSKAAQITLGGNYIDSYPAWSIVGENIVFTQVPIAGGIPRLATAAFVEGKVVESQFDFGPIPLREASFSPDGLWLIFESWPDGVNHDIYLSSANGAGRRQITDFPSNEFDAVWRPRS
ncbi:MAG: TolB family protein, partial [Anaerolineales bacterium]